MNGPDKPLETRVEPQQDPNPKEAQPSDEDRKLRNYYRSQWLRGYDFDWGTSGGD